MTYVNYQGQYPLCNSSLAFVRIRQNTREWQQLGNRVQAPEGFSPGPFSLFGEDHGNFLESRRRMLTNLSRNAHRGA